MTTEQYSIGYEEGHQAGWNAAMESLLPQRQRLTDAEINEIELPPSGTATVRDMVRLIEVAHGIRSA